MASIGDGYGSEFNLKRYLDHYPEILSQYVMNATGAQSVNWQDHRSLEGEWKALEFLPKGSEARIKWKKFWPPSGKQHHWDAVGRILMEGEWEWLLVEAKSHLTEIKTECKASERGGRPKIRKAFNETKRALGIPEDADWLTGYYQFANRIAALYFLTRHHEIGRLLFVYFCGDSVPNKVCPASENEWLETISQQDEHLGLSICHPLADRVHKAFLPIAD